MSINLPRDLQEEIDAEVMASLERGLAVRRRNVAWSGLFLAGSLLVLAVSSPSSAIVVAVMLAVSTLCIIWALMSMSASLNAQFDGLVILLKFYAEHYRVHQEEAQQNAPADAAKRRR